MTSNIELLGIQVEVPSDCAWFYYCEDDHSKIGWWRQDIIDSSCKDVDGLGPASLAIVAACARCWWLEKAEDVKTTTSGSGRDYQRSVFEERADAWAQVFRKAMEASK